MLTVQKCLKSVDRKEIIDQYMYHFPPDYLMVENKVKTWATESVRLTRVDGAPEHEEQVEELDLKALKRDLPELFKPDYDGGYLVTKTVKKSGRKGYVKITRLKGGD